jgi:hypothetical protein
MKLKSLQERAESRLVKLAKQVARESTDDAEKWADVLEIWLVFYRPEHRQRYMAQIWVPEHRRQLETWRQTGHCNPETKGA